MLRAARHADPALIGLGRSVPTGAENTAPWSVLLFATACSRPRMKSISTDDDAFGKGRIRVDGRGEFPSYLLQMKIPAESKGGWDLYKLIVTARAAEVVHPLEPKCNFI
jgi:hypothetical protein